MPGGVMAKSIVESKSDINMTDEDSMSVDGADCLLVKQAVAARLTTPISMRNKATMANFNVFLESLDWDAMSQESWASGMRVSCKVKSIIEKIEGLTGCPLSLCNVTSMLQGILLLQVEEPDGAILKF
ncbi:unnamed protein product [Calypogeia fissa]